MLKSRGNTFENFGKEDFPKTRGRKKTRGPGLEERMSQKETTVDRQEARFKKREVEEGRQEVFVGQPQGKEEETGEKGRGRDGSRKKIKVEKREENQRQQLVDGFFIELEQKFKEGIINEDLLKEYLKNYPTRNEYEAYEQLRREIEEEEIDNEIKKITENPDPFLRGESSRRTVSQKIGQKDSHKVEVITKRGRGNTRQAVGNWSKDFWHKALVWDYARRAVTPEDITNFFDNFSPEKREAYQKFLDEIEEVPELEPEESEKRKTMVLKALALKDEFLDEIPTQEGRTIFEEMLEEQLDQFSDFLNRSIKKEDIETMAETLGGDMELAEKELLKEAAKKFLVKRELVVHGIMGYDEEKKYGLRKKSDLDGDCATSLLRQAGIGLGEIEYVFPGDFRKAKHNVDTAERDGFEIEYDWEKIFADKKELQEINKALFDAQNELGQEEDEAGREELEGKIDSLLEEKGKKIEELKLAQNDPTVYSDHHGEYSDRGTSSMKIVYELLNKFGLLKFENENDRVAYDRLVELVTQIDNFNFPGIKDRVEEKERNRIKEELIEDEIAFREMDAGRNLTLQEKEQAKTDILDRLPTLTKYETSHRRMIGLGKFAGFEQILKFAKSGIAPDAFLSFDELQRFGFGYRDKKGKPKGFFLGRKRIVEETLKVVEEELAPNEWSVETKYGKFLVNTTGKLNVQEAQWAGASLGYNGLVSFDPEQNKFFITLSEGQLDPNDFSDLPQGKLIRRSIFFKNDDERLEVTLGELLNKIKEPSWNPGQETELSKFLEKEEKRERKEIYWSDEARCWWTRQDNGDLVIVENSRDIPRDFPSGGEAFIKKLRLIKEPEPLKSGAGAGARGQYEAMKRRYDAINETFGVKEYYLARCESLRLTDEEKEKLQERREKNARGKRKNKPPTVDNSQGKKAEVPKEEKAEVKPTIAPEVKLPEETLGGRSREEEAAEAKRRMLDAERTATEQVAKAQREKINEKRRKLEEALERARQEVLVAKKRYEGLGGWQFIERPKAEADYRRKLTEYKRIKRELEILNSQEKIAEHPAQAQSQKKTGEIKKLGEDLERARQEVLSAKKVAEKTRKKADIERHEQTLARYKDIQGELLRKKRE